MSQALIQFSKDERALLRKTIAPGTTQDQFDLFVQVCKHTGLNPFARQIYAVVRKEKQRDGSYGPKMTIQTSIDGYRLLAQRSGEYAGQEGPLWYDADNKEWVDVWLSDKAPAAAKVGVMRKGFIKPIWAVARFESYVVRGYNEHTRKYDGAPQNLWAKMPELMIAKVAEALALRRAFPAELSGIYTHEEMQQAEKEGVDLPMPIVEQEHTSVVEGEVDEDVSPKANAPIPMQQPALTLAQVRTMAFKAGYKGDGFNGLVIGIFGHMLSDAELKEQDNLECIQAAVQVALELDADKAKQPKEVA